MTVSAEPDRASRIARLGHILDEAGTGLKAELRRLDPGAADRWRSPGFYRLLDEIAPDSSCRDGDETRWAMIFSGMAHLPHRKGSKPGRALAEAGYAESRFARLLSANEARLGDELRAAVSFLKAKRGDGVDWLPLASLALSRQDSEEYDPCRRHLAEDYYYHDQKG